MVLINRLAVVLVMAGALFFVAREGGHDSVSRDPEALWDGGVERVEATISGDAQTTVEDNINDSMQYAESFGEDVSMITD
jgi:hypothetical protein